MQASATGFPKPPDSEESPAQALLLERHGLEDSLKEILAAIQARKNEGQHSAEFQ